MSNRSKMSIAFWLMMLAILTVVDVFVTPSFMNHAHGAVRWLGFAIGGITVLPIAMLAARLYQKIRIVLFTKGL